MIRQGDEFFGYNPPFFGGPGNVLSKQIGSRLIMNDIKQLLLTKKRERVHRPTFGTDIRSLVFENVNDSDISDLETQVREAIETYESRVNLDSVIISLKDSKTLVIRVICSLVNNPQTILDFEIPVKAS